MSAEIENIQKILKMQLLKKEHDKRKHNPIKDEFEEEKTKFNDYFF